MTSVPTSGGPWISQHVWLERAQDGYRATRISRETASREIRGRSETDGTLPRAEKTPPCRTSAVACKMHHVPTMLKINWEGGAALLRLTSGDRCNWGYCGGGPSFKNVKRSSGQAVALRRGDRGTTRSGSPRRTRGPQLRAERQMSPVGMRNPCTPRATASVITRGMPQCSSVSQSWELS